MEDEAIAEALSNANKRTQTYYSRGAVWKLGESAEQQAARKANLAQQRSKNGKAVRAARGLKKRGSKVGSKHRGRKLKILDPEEPGISTTEKTIRAAICGAHSGLRKKYRLGEKRIPGETAEQQEASRVDAETYVFPHKAKATRKAAKEDDTMQQQKEEEDDEEYQEEDEEEDEEQQEEEEDDEE